MYICTYMCIYIYIAYTSYFSCAFTWACFTKTQLRKPDFCHLPFTVCRGAAKASKRQRTSVKIAKSNVVERKPVWLYCEGMHVPDVLAVSSEPWMWREREREGDVTEHTNTSAKGTTAGQTPARTAYIKGVLGTCVITYLVINWQQKTTNPINAWRSLFGRLPWPGYKFVTLIARLSLQY